MPVLVQCPIFCLAILNWSLHDCCCPVQLLSIGLPLLYPLLNELPARRMVKFGNSSLPPHIPLFLPGIDHTDRIFRISSSQIEMVSSLRYDQSCGSSHRLQHSSAGPGVEQPVGKDNVGRRLETSSSVQGVGKGWPADIQFSKS